MERRRLKFLLADDEKNFKKLYKDNNPQNRAKSMLNKHASPARSSIYQDGREGLNPVHSVHKTTAIAFNRAKCLGENE